MWLIYLLYILCTVACVVYGLLNWNEDVETGPLEFDKEFKWNSDKEMKTY